MIRLQNVRDYLQHHFVGPQNVIFYISILVIAVFVARQYERRWPIDPGLPKSEVISDWKVIAVKCGVGMDRGIATYASCGAAIVNAAGGGFIPLRTDGWWFAVSLLVFLVVADLNRYITFIGFIMLCRSCGRCIHSTTVRRR